MHTGVGEASQSLNPDDGKAATHPERVWLGTDNGPEDVNSLPGLQIPSVADNNIPPPMPQGATRQRIGVEWPERTLAVVMRGPCLLTPIGTLSLTPTCRPSPFQ
ncbi:hypothetical protein CGCF413_v008615 [Colletotrichum fructicola]|nr:hypothetical protein CGCF413_v008615 [Colletotrichum fructicola]